MKRRKKKHPAPPRRKKSARGRRPIKIEVFVPAHVPLDGAELGELTHSHRLSLATLGSKRSSMPPAFVTDEKLWRKAMRTVSPHWKRYDYPYAAVAFVYLRMGGTISSGHSGHHAHHAPERGRAPAARARAPRRDVSLRADVHVEPVELDELGYDDAGTYYGSGDPLWRVVSDSPYFDVKVRANTAAQAKSQALSRFRH